MILSLEFLLKQKNDGSLGRDLNLKKLYAHINYNNFKMEFINNILNMVVSFPRHQQYFL